MVLKERSYPIQSTIKKLFIATESVDGVGIGRETLTVSRLRKLEFSPELCAMLSALNKQDNNEQRRRLHFHLNWNTADPHGLIPHERPASAYFTYNPSNQVVLIEWGLVDPKNNEAKLHNYLNRSLNMSERAALGMKISSGHLARLTGTNQYVALIDNLSHEMPREKITLPMKQTINTLHNNSIIPITSEGFVRLPVF